MDSLLTHQSSGCDPDHEEHVGFFRKLGYSTPQVKAALSKLGLNPDINSVLGELVQTSAPQSSTDKRSLVRSNETLPPSPLRPSPHLWDRKIEDSDLRPVVIDGSNVAMSHGNKEVFSCRGIQLAANFFLDRGHKSVTVFVPTWRKEQSRPDAPISDQHVLMELEKQKIVVFTPSRHVGGKRVVCYDDRFIVKLAYESNGVIVSNDTYRDLQGERPEWKKCIEERLVMYSFVNDKFMPPDDPLGRHGPSLDNFLRKKPLPTEQKKLLCPYDKKCTYGIKCKFFHPERVNHPYVSLADELREKANISKVREEKKAGKHAHSLSETVPQKSKEQHKWSSLPVQVSENKLPQWDDPGKSPQLCSGAVDQPWPHHYHIPYEYMDSGLGSYRSLYSDCSSQKVEPHPRHTPESCRCCSPVLPSMAFNYFPNESQLKGAFPTVSSDHWSLPSQYKETSKHQQYYWSNPVQGRMCSSRSSVQAPQLSNVFHSRNQQPKREEAKFDPQRLELRDKLHAIFNPHQVDAVMEMFPHLTDTEELAAEILTMKAQGRL